MRILMYVLLCLFVSMLVGCRSYCVETIVFKPYTNDDYVTKVLNVYEVKELLHPILDSVIVKAEQCSTYQKAKPKIAFSLGIEDTPKDSSCFVKLFIDVIYEPEYKMHTYTRGLFHYKGYIFHLYFSDSFLAENSLMRDIQKPTARSRHKIMLDNFLEKTDRRFIQRYITPEKYQFVFHDRSNLDMYWVYRYEGGVMENIQYNNDCPEEGWYYEFTIYSPRKEKFTSNKKHK